MRRIGSSVLLLALAASWCSAQQDRLVGYPTQKQPVPAFEPQAALAEPAPTGFYASPPLTGTVAGGTRSIGLDGFALHFPALTLKLPTIQLPSLMRLRTNARMLIDPAQAPYVQQTPMAYGAAAVGVQASPQPAAQDSAIQDMPAKDKYPSNPVQDSAQLDLHQQLREREYQLARMQHDFAQLAAAAENLSRGIDGRVVPAKPIVEIPAPARWVSPVGHEPVGPIARDAAVRQSAYRGPDGGAQLAQFRRLPPVTHQADNDWIRPCTTERVRAWTHSFDTTPRFGLLPPVSAAEIRRDVSPVPAKIRAAAGSGHLWQLGIGLSIGLLLGGGRAYRRLFPPRAGLLVHLPAPESRPGDFAYRSRQQAR